MSSPLATIKTPNNFKWHSVEPLTQLFQEVYPFIWLKISSNFYTLFVEQILRYKMVYRLCFLDFWLLNDKTKTLRICQLWSRLFRVIPGERNTRWKTTNEWAETVYEWASSNTRTTVRFASWKSSQIRLQSVEHVSWKFIA